MLELTTYSSYNSLQIRFNRYVQVSQFCHNSALVFKHSSWVGGWVCITSAKSFTFFNAAAACWSWGSNDVTLTSWFGLAQFWRQKLGCYEICCISCREVRWFSTLYIHFVDSCRGESAILHSTRHFHIFFQIHLWHNFCLWHHLHLWLHFSLHLLLNLFH